MGSEIREGGRRARIKTVIGKPEVAGEATAPVGSTQPLAGPAVPGPNVNKHGPGPVSCSLSGGY